MLASRKKNLGHDAYFERPMSAVCPFFFFKCSDCGPVIVSNGHDVNKRGYCPATAVLLSKIKVHTDNPGPSSSIERITSD